MPVCTAVPSAIRSLMVAGFAAPPVGSNFTSLTIWVTVACCSSAAVVDLASPIAQTRTTNPRENVEAWAAPPLRLSNGSRPANPWDDTEVVPPSFVFILKFCRERDCAANIAHVVIEHVLIGIVVRERADRAD